MRLGESRRVVDAVARHGDRAPLALEFGDRVRLLVGHHLSHDFVDPEALGNRFSGGSMVTGQHDRAHAVVVQRTYSCGSRCLDRIGNAQHTKDLTLPNDQDHRLPILPQLVGADRSDLTEHDGIGR